MAARSLIDTASTSRTASTNSAARRRRTKWREVSPEKNMAAANLPLAQTRAAASGRVPTEAAW